MKKRIQFRTTNLKDHISKRRFIIGILIGLLFSFSFYAILFSFRESFRVFFSTHTFTNHILILKENEIAFYNFIYALFASILGLSIAFKFILEKPKQFSSKSSTYKKHSIFNDLSALNSVFLGVGIKFFFVTAIFFSSMFSYYFSFYPDYNYLSYLLLSVLFLEQWKTIRLIAKNKALKWMAIAFVSIIVYSFILSKIDIIDYKSINNKYLSTQMDYKYELELPEVIHFKKLERLSQIHKLYLAYPKGKVNHNKFPTILTEDQETYSLETLTLFINQVKHTHSEYELPILTFNLHIDKHIKMKHIKLLKNTIAKNGFYKIAYGVTQKDSDLPKELQFNRVVFERLKKVIPPLPPEPKIVKENLYQIKVNTNNSLQINGVKKSMDLIEIKNFILKAPKKNVFQLQFSDVINLEDYLKVKDILLTAYQEIRTDLSLKAYGLPLSELNREQLRFIKIKYPQHIWIKD